MSHRTRAFLRCMLTLLTLFTAATIGGTRLHAQQQPATAAKPSEQTKPAEPTTPPAITTALPGRQSWVSDRRDFHLGDIITILVDEYTLTSLDKQVDATDNRQRDMNLGLSTPSSSSSYGFGTGSKNSSTNSGSDSRKNRLTTEMAARVIEIAPNGLIRLEGAKALNVEKTKINLSLSGWVRTQDVSPTNFVQSYTMADAKLDYQAEGPLGSPKGGILGRILGKFWP